MSFYQINNMHGLNRYFGLAQIRLYGQTSNPRREQIREKLPPIEEVFNKFKDLAEREPEVLDESWEMLNKLEDIVLKGNAPESLMEKINSAAKILTDKETKEQTFGRLIAFFDTNQHLHAQMPPSGLDKFDPKIPEDKQMLFEIAECVACAKNSPLASMLHLFGFDKNDPTDQEHLYELIGHISRKIVSREEFNNFGFDISDPKVKMRLFQILKNIAWPPLENVSTFQLDTKIPEIKAWILEIAKMELETPIEKGQAPRFSIVQRYYLDPKDEEDERAIFDLLFCSAKVNGGRFVNHLEGSGFELDKGLLDELYRIAARNRSQPLVDENTPKSFGFDLNIPTDRKMIVGIIKAQIATSIHLENNSHLTDMEVLLKHSGFNDHDPEVQEIKEYARSFCLKNASDGKTVITPSLIEKYGLDRQFRQKNAIEAANQNILRFISDRIPEVYGFDFFDEEDRICLIEIAKAAYTSPSLWKIGPERFLTECAYLSGILGFYDQIPNNLEKIKELLEHVITNHPDYSIFAYATFTTEFNRGELDQFLPFCQKFMDFFSIKQKFGALVKENDPDVNNFEFIKFYLDFQNKTVPMPFANIPSAKAVLENHLNIISKQEEFEREQNYRFLPILLYNALKSGNPEAYFDKLEKMKLLDAFRQVRNPDIRFQLAIIAKEENFPEIATSMNLLPLMLVNSFREMKFSEEQIKEMTALVNCLKTRIDGQNPFLKDNIKALSLIALLFDLRENELLDPAEKVLLLKKVLTPPDKKEGLNRTLLLQANCEAVSAIISLGGAANLKNLAEDKSVDYSQVLYDSFVDMMPQLKAVPDLLNAFKSTFGRSRNPSAIYNYTGSLNKIPDVEIRNTSLNNLSDFILVVLNGTFTTARMEALNNPHLQVLPKHLLEDWSKTMMTKRIVGGTGEDETPLHIRLKEVLENAVKQAHFTPMTIDVDSDPLLQRLLDPAATIEQRTTILQEFKEKLPADCTFIGTDLPLIYSILKAPNVKVLLPVEYVFSNTDDSTDMLAMGTEVLGSCQNINGNGTLNRGLLGYMMNGQNRLLTMKLSKDNPTYTKISGRALIRMLVTEDGTPVMQLEKIYPASLHPAQKKALIDFAKEEAARLGVDIVSQKDGNPSKPYNQKVLDHGGPVEEYVDAMGGQTLYRDFTLTGMYRL